MTAQKAQSPVAIRVLLADDENLIRGAMRSLLALESDIEVVAEAASGTEAVAMARMHRPDVAVLDLQMPGLDGIETAQALRLQAPGTATMIVTKLRPTGLPETSVGGRRTRIPAQDSVGRRTRRCRPHCPQWRPLRRPGASRRCDLCG